MDRADADEWNKRQKELEHLKRNTPTLTDEQTQELFKDVEKDEEGNLHNEQD